MTEEITETIDSGYAEVQIATIGKVVGSDIEGNPVEQNFTEESLQKIADNTKEDVLVDADHESETGGSTEAKGWISNLKFIKGKGLFGRLKFTDIGKRLVENRIFRWLSPSWLLDSETKEPVQMTSVALTNKPSQKGRIDAIINSEPIEFNNTKDILDMSKEELKETIKEILTELKAEEVKNEEPVEEKTEEKPVENGCGGKDLSPDAVKNGCGGKDLSPDAVKNGKDLSPDAVKNGCGGKDLSPDAVKNEDAEEKCDDCKEKEVIAIETLNSAPSVPAVAEVPMWKTLNGKAFCDYINSGKYK